MRILVYGLNYAPELTGIGKFTGEMCEWFAANENQVRVVTAPKYYPGWVVERPFYAWKYGRAKNGSTIVYRCPVYVPKRPTFLARLLHLVSFAMSSLPMLLWQLQWRPNLVIVIVPTFFCVPGAVLIAALARAKSVLHIQDFELDAMLGLGIGTPGLLTRVGRRVESWLMKRFDAVSTVSMSMCNRVAEKTDRGSDILLCPNWVDMKSFERQADRCFYVDEWQIEPSKRVILYSGNIGEKQGLDLVVAAAEVLQYDEDILFVIVGTGATRAALEATAKRKQLQNVRFYPLQPIERVPSLLALADIHLVVQRKGAADLVMPSKLAAIFACGGHSLITADADTELGRLCAENPGIALRVEPENLDSFVEGIKTLLTDSDVIARRRNSAAYQFALTHLDKEHVLSAFCRDLEALQVR